MAAVDGLTTTITAISRAEGYLNRPSARRSTPPDGSAGG